MKNNRYPTILTLLTLLMVVCTMPVESGRAPALVSPTPTPFNPSPASPEVPAPSPIPLNSATPAPPDEALPSTPTPTASIPATQYTLEALFDYNRHYLAVEERIAYTNAAPDPLPDLLLIVEPNRWPGGFVLKALTWGDGQTIEAYSLVDNRLHIPLPQPLPPGESLDLSLSYELFLPAIPEPSDTLRPVPYGYTSRQTNVVDWYPYAPPYRPGSGWLAHEAWFFGEHQVYDVADYQVDIHLVEPVEGLVIAASAPAELDGDGYHYHLENARSFAWSASPLYQVHTATVGEVTVYSYAFPFSGDGGEATLRHTADALALYSELFGPYRHASLSVVEADFLDGMEYDGLFFLSRGFYNTYDGSPKGYLTAIAVHETAHQWWYGLVGNDQALEPWLDEALCTYSERLFYERVYPEESAGSGQSLVDWWWAFRVDFYQPAGWVDGSIYDYAGFRPYRDATYLRGAQFFEDLRNMIGDEAFFAFLQDYARRYAHKQASATDFFAILEEHTPADLSELLALYFASAGR